MYYHLLVRTPGARVTALLNLVTSAVSHLINILQPRPLLDKSPSGPFKISPFGVVLLFS